MKKTFAHILLLITSCGSFALGQEEIKIYDWEVAKMASPDTIYGISFAKLKLLELPEELEKFKNIQVLDLQNNKLTYLPDFLGDFNYLKELNASRNKLELFPLQVCRMVSLERLILNRNDFENLPECIEFARELKYVDLYDTPIQGLPESITRLNHLEKIDFSGIRFSPSFQKKWIGLLPNVELIFDAPCDCMEH